MKRYRRLEQKIKEFIGTALEMPSASVIGGASVTLTDGREVYVTGCRSILSYNDQYIELSTGLGKIGIVGSQLDISGYTDTDIAVRGSISSISIAEDEQC